MSKQSSIPLWIRFRLGKTMLSTILMPVLFYTSAQAQCDSLSQIQTLPYYAVTENGLDTTNVIPANEILPYYYFTQQQSKSTITYRIGEFSHGQHWVYLDRWCDGMGYNYTPVTSEPTVSPYSSEELSNLSRTKSFPIQAGDSLTFYREFFWVNEGSNSVDPTQLHLDSDVSFSVTLMTTIDDTPVRIALLDSTLFRAQPRMAPCIVTWYPPMRRVLHVVPSEYTEPIDAYIQVNMQCADPHSNGDIATFNLLFQRYDALQAALSKGHLRNPYWVDYANRVTGSLSCSSDCPDDDWTLYANGSTAYAHAHTLTGGKRTVEVYDFAGNLRKSIPLTDTTPHVILEGARGTFVVVMKVGGRMACSKVITL